jgi:hypothetical protein
VQRAFGWGQLGSQKVKTLGLSSSNSFQQTFASCTVTVYLSGTLTLATIYSDNVGTSLSNPFTADTTGAWAFYAANGRYDVSLTGGGITGTITYPDILLTDVGSGGAITSLNGLTTTTQTFATGTAGTDFAIVSSGSAHTFNIPSASASKRGLLTSADWTTFNGKQATLSFNAPLSLSGSAVSLTLPLTIAQGGTGQVTASAAFTALSPLTTKGDLLASNGSSSTRLAVGTNGQVLVADSTAGLGVKWATDPFSSLSIPLTVPNGGTGLTGGNSGGIPYFSGATAITSSAVLTAGAPVIGGGAGTAPTTSGAATTYNGQTLAGNGLVVVVFSSQVQTNKTSTATDQILLTAPTAGNYRISYYLFTGSVSDGTATAQVTVKWTDSVGAKVTTPLAALALAAAANQTATYLVQVASGNITYTSTYSAGAGGNYNLLIIVERL